MSDVTEILSKIESGHGSASEDLLPLVYDELRKLAASRMSSQRLDHTLQPTALVHEAYMRLVDVDQVKHWESRGHFFAAAAQAMRCILIDYARGKDREKRGGKRKSQSLANGPEIAMPAPPEELFAVHESLDRLAEIDADAANVVKLRFFAGFSMPEVADALGRSLRSVERDWRFARTWLHRQISIDQEPVEAGD